MVLRYKSLRMDLGKNHKDLSDKMLFVSDGQITAYGSILTIRVITVFIVKNHKSMWTLSKWFKKSLVTSKSN